MKLKMKREKNVQCNLNEDKKIGSQPNTSAFPKRDAATNVDEKFHWFELNQFFFQILVFSNNLIHLFVNRWLQGTWLLVHPPLKTM